MKIIRWLKAYITCFRKGIRWLGDLWHGCQEQANQLAVVWKQAQKILGEKNQKDDGRHIPFMFFPYLTHNGTAKPKMSSRMLP